MMTPREARRRLALSDTDLARAIEVQTHSILGSFRVLSARGTYPMGGLRVERVSARRTALVGDAAHGFPPIGAQGLNLGLRDVATLVVCLDGAQDPGAQMHLNAYQAQREPDIRLRTTAVDVMNRALLDHSLPMDFLRGVGLTTLAHMGPLRRLAMRQGLGGM
jgi:2-octaprenyl-6-methoxyphenol hydroxylase